MNQAERSIMRGMVDILNESKKRPILTEEQYKMRLSDLKEFEESTNFVFMHSPTCKDKIGSVVKFNSNIYKNSFDKCHDVESVVKFVNQKEMLIYPNIIGNDITIAYCNGVIDHLIIDNAIVNLTEVTNIPYKINRNGTYIVSGILHNLNFYVTNIVDGVDNETVFDNLKKAEDLGFDVVPYWVIGGINPKKFQSSIDYIYQYAEEDELLCNGVVFTFNNIEYGKTLGLKNGIVYEVKDDTSETK